MFKFVMEILIRFFRKRNVFGLVFEGWVYIFTVNSWGMFVEKGSYI